jgi:hypothetical protein
MIINVKRKATSVLMATSLSLALFAGCESTEKTTDVAELTDFAARYAAAWSSQDPAALASFYFDNGSLLVNAGAPLETLLDCRGMSAWM